jgi:hypothetical protein
MARGITALENVAKEGGVRAAKAAEKLAKARQAYQAALAEFNAERKAVNAARELVQNSKLAQSALKGELMMRFGNAAVRLEIALQSSRLGRALLPIGRIVSSKAFVRGLVVVGAALEGISSYTDSTAQTTAGKVTNSILGAGGGALTMANPVVAVLDMLAPKGYKLSEVYHGGAGAVTAIGEGLLTGDTRAMDEFHKRSMEGHYGKVMQLSSEAGEYWLENGIRGGLEEFVRAIHWWDTLPSPHKFERIVDRWPIGFK